MSHPTPAALSPLPNTRGGQCLSPLCRMEGAEAPGPQKELLVVQAEHLPPHFLFRGRVKWRSSSVGKSCRQADSHSVIQSFILSLSPPSLCPPLPLSPFSASVSVF